MEISKDEIDNYLAEVKEEINNNNYIIALNDKRQENRNLFFDYVIDEAAAREILLALEVTDFSESVPNEHPGFEYEMLYIFGKDVELLERAGEDGKKKKVSLYIKINKLNDSRGGRVIVVSFHEQQYPLKYYFK